MFMDHRDSAYIYIQYIYIHTYIPSENCTLSVSCPPRQRDDISALLVSRLQRCRPTSRTQRAVWLAATTLKGWSQRISPDRSLISEIMFSCSSFSLKCCLYLSNKTFKRILLSLQSDYRHPWRPDRPFGYLPLSELDSGLGCGPDSPDHRMVLSEAETDAMSSLPGHTPSSQGSSSSSESLTSSEPSDSGFHSVSTGDHRRLHKVQGSHGHRQSHHLRTGHSPREQRGRWDLESIPETTQMSHPGAPLASRCTVGNSTTTTVHFHRAERSPTRHRSPAPPSVGKSSFFFSTLPFAKLDK